MDVNGERGFSVGQRLLGREICFDTENERPKNGFERMTNGLCIVCAAGRVGREEDDNSKSRGDFLGGQRNDFRKQKLKGFPFRKDMIGENIPWDGNFGQYLKNGGLLL